MLNDDGTLKGVSKARSLVHRDGDLHRSTHIWIISGASSGSADTKLLLQKRAVGKDTFPGRWDVSAAGHICAGDNSLDSAKRELEEELGLSMEIEKAFQARACNIGRTEKHGEFIDNELQDVYVAKKNNSGDIDINLDVKSLKLQEEEVERVEYWDWCTFKQKQLDGDAHFVPRTKEYLQLLEKYLEEKWAAKEP